MNIKEAGAHSGVSVRNIRFYEQKGLLSPARNPENDYRDYGEDDVDRLKLIRALRMVDMPLETIRAVLSGDALLSDAAAAHCADLTGKIKKLETALQFCRELSDGAVSDVDELLDRMDAADSEKLLPRTWLSDHAEAAKALLVPLSAGLIPIMLGTVSALASIYCAALWLPLMFVPSVLYLFCWGWIGYGLHSREDHSHSVLLAHVFPGIFLVCGMYYQMMPADGIPHPFLELGLAYHLPLLPFTRLLGGWLSSSFLAFALMLLSFSIGALLSCWHGKRRSRDPLPGAPQR